MGEDVSYLLQDFFKEELVKAFDGIGIEEEALVVFEVNENLVDPRDKLTSD